MCCGEELGRSRCWRAAAAGVDRLEQRSMSQMPAEGGSTLAVLSGNGRPAELPVTTASGPVSSGRSQCFRPGPESQEDQGGSRMSAWKSAGAWPSRRRPRRIMVWLEFGEDLRGTTQHQPCRRRDEHLAVAPVYLCISAEGPIMVLLDLPSLSRPIAAWQGRAPQNAVRKLNARVNSPSRNDCHEGSVDPWFLYSVVRSNARRQCARRELDRPPPLPPGLAILPPRAMRRRPIRSRQQEMAIQYDAATL